jgi:23S rRNA-intervening sequence protein
MTAAAKDLVIFTQTWDLLTWLLPHCEDFPKSQRFIVTQRLVGAALDFQESIFDANARNGADRLRHLQAADAFLNKLRLYLRLSNQWQWLSAGQYEHASRWSPASASCWAAGSGRLGARTLRQRARAAPACRAESVRGGARRALAGLAVPRL